MTGQIAVKDNNRLHLINEYGKQKLCGYAESFRELADLFEEDEPDTDISDSCEEMCRRFEMDKGCDVLADQMREMSHILREVAGTAYDYYPVKKRKFRQVVRYMKDSGILVRDFMVIEKEDGHKEFSLSMKRKKGGVFRYLLGSMDQLRDIADYLSVILNTRLMVSGNGPSFLTDSWINYYFAEQPKYRSFTGVAKAVKETEKVSGDSYSFYKGREGLFLTMLSDGMGSGEKAQRDSSRVIEMMENLTEAGFGRESALQLLNGYVYSTGREQAASSLDFCEINLYSAECHFLKMGAACTYIKRGNLVERISAENLPLGVFGQADFDVEKRILHSGDYVVMFSDGILDALSQGVGEDMLPELIGRLEYDNPNELANQILTYCIHQSRGQIRDDMTVLVTGIFEEEQEDDVCFFSEKCL